MKYNSNLHDRVDGVNHFFQPKHRRYQHVRHKGKNLILRRYKRDYDGHGQIFWHGWIVTDDGIIHDMRYTVSDDDIEGLVNEILYVDMIHVRKLSGDYSHFINHYEQLKVNDFLNNLQ